MGHANFKNLSQFFIRRLYAKGTLSLSEAIKAAVAAGETVHASEGEHKDEGTLGMAFVEIISHFGQPNSEVEISGKGEFVYDPGNVIEPAAPLSKEQVRVLKLWIGNEIFDLTGTEEEKAWAVFDKIPWRFAPGQRKLYPNFNLLENFTN